jgi:arsenite/tail-anchored protein-transporting ATPase
MSCRTILYTGKGGVGKTSVAAATARRCAAEGARTLVVSTDPAHSLGDVLETGLGPAPSPVGDRLWGQQITAQVELEANWAAVQEWAGSMLLERGVDRITADELTVPPGADELFALLAIRRHHESGEYDVVVVDCAPTGETLRLLSFPDVARWWLERVFPQQGRILDAARPFARAVLDVQLPGEAVLSDVRALVENLIAMHEILRDREHVTLRLVMNPDRMVVDEARRTFTYLNLYGFLTDAVVVNRVFPDDVGPYFAAWRATQQDAIADVDAAFAPVPVLHAPYFEQEVRGPEMLDRLGDALFAGRAAGGVLHTALTQELVVRHDGAVLRLSLPFADKRDLQLRKIGAELVVRVGPHKRTMLLPAALTGYRPTGATFEEDALVIRFDAPAQAVAHDA